MLQPSIYLRQSLDSLTLSYAHVTSREFPSIVFGNKLCKSCFPL
uniref:Uncharacterized protein n=1 Tax=Rhizophora mucronata TaxID=61149 RepID=A0A2P2R3N6_RHIMU